VPIAVLHHLVERAVHGLGCGLLGGVVVLVLVVVLHDLVDDLLLVLVAAVLHALLDHVAGELVVAESDDVALHLPDDLVLVFLDLPMF
ncbi:MAG: hypothetical protein ACMG6E_05915, partial [Candidatus Roizmanbacteria bacterium]